MEEGIFLFHLVQHCLCSPSHQGASSGSGLAAEPFDSQMLQALTSNIPGGFFLFHLDEARTVDYISEGMLEMIECTPLQFQECYGGCMHNALYGEDMERVKRLETESPEGFSRQFEYRFRTRSGRVKWMLGNRRIFMDSRGQRMAWVNVLDITELHVVNTLLEQTAVEITSLTNHVPGGLAKIVADEDTVQVILANDAFYHLLGYCKEDFDRDPAMTQITTFVHPEDLPQVQKLIQTGVETGNALQTGFRVYRKDGSIACLWVSGIVVDRIKGMPVIQGVFIDATEETQAIQQINSLKEQLLSLFNTIPGGVAQLRIRSHTQVLYANQQFYQLLGYPDGKLPESCAEDLSALVHPEDKEELTTVIRAQLRHRKPLSAEFRLVRPDRSLLWVSLHGNQTRNHEGHTVYQCILMDVSHLKSIQEHLMIQQTRDQILLECSNNIIYDYDLESDTMVFSQKVNTANGPKAVRHTVRHYRDNLYISSIVHPDDRQKLEAVCRGIPDLHFEIRCTLPDMPKGQFFWHELRGTVICDPKGKPLQSVGVMNNIEERKQQLQIWKNRAERDPLTGLYNKTSANASICNYLQNDGAGRTHALMIIDLDNFKGVNDTYGHPFGDLVLTEFSHRLSSFFRSSDLIGRVGGDEFTVFLKDVASVENILEKTKLLCRTMTAAPIGIQERYQVSLSVGISIYPEDGNSFETLFRRADLALYTAKDKGKNRFERFEPWMEHQAVRQRAEDMARMSQPSEEQNGYQLLKGVIELCGRWEEPDQTIYSVLRLLGNDFMVSRAFLILEQPQRELYEWHQEDETDRTATHLLSLDDAAQQEYIARFDPVSHRFCLNNIESLRGSSPYLYQYLQRHRVQATLQSEVHWGACQGIIGVDDCKAPRAWSKGQEETISVIAKLLENYILWLQD